MAKIISIVQFPTKDYDFMVNVNEPLPPRSIIDFYEFCFYSALSGVKMQSQDSVLTMRFISETGRHYINCYSKVEILILMRRLPYYDDIMEVYVSHMFNVWNLLSKSNVKPAVCYYSKSSHHRRDTSLIEYGLVYRTNTGVYPQPFYFNTEIKFITSNNKYRVENYTPLYIINVAEYAGPYPTAHTPD